MFPKQTGARSGAAPLSRPGPRLLLALALVAAVGTVLLPAPAEAVSRSSQTMYTPPSGTPAPGTLYPRGIRLEHNGSANGTMLATFEQYTNGKPVFPIYRSTDTGNSWTKISEVADTQNGWGMRWQPQLFELPTAIGNFPAGTILAAGDSVPSNRSGFKIDMYASTNQGQTWTFVKTIANGGGRPVWEPFFLVNGNKIIVYYSDERDSSHSQKLVHQVSTDLVNWGSVVDDVATSTQSNRPGMSTVAKLPNGNYVMTYEFGGAPEGNLAVYYKISSNPEAFGSVSGRVLKSTDGHIAKWNPYITWLPTGGSNGTLVVSAQSTADVFVNTQGGAANAWTRVDSKVAAGYSRGMIPLADGHSLVVLSGGVNGSTVNSVTYSTIDLGGGGATTTTTSRTTTTSTTSRTTTTSTTSRTTTTSTTSGATTTSTTGGGSGGCTASFDPAINSWSTGFVANVKITSTATVNSWRVTVNLPAGATVTGSWNGTFSGTSGAVTVTPASDWNAQVTPSSPKSFGFQANGSPDGISLSCAAA